MKLVVLDADALIHRAYHALPPLSTQKGEPTNAIYGFFSIFIKMVQTLKPDYIIAAFDTHAPTFRKKVYDAYKAHRPKIDDELISQLQRMKTILDDIDVLTLAKDGYEADDIIGTITSQLSEKRKAKKEKVKNLEIIIVTGDLDTLQLIRDGVKVYTMRKGMSDVVIYNRSAVLNRFGLEPEQLPDYKGLVGDASDNIPGINGVGPKTATQLLQKFGTLEKLFASKEVPLKLKDKKDQALFSKELATINQESPVSFRLGDATWHGFDSAKLDPLFSHLGFASLSRRIKETPLTSEKQNSLFLGNKPQNNLSGGEYALARIASWLLNPELKNPEPSRPLSELKEQLETQGLLKVFEEIEAPLVPIIDYMQSIGIKVDKGAISALETELSKEIKQVRQEMFRLAEGEFNPASPDQLRVVLFEKLKLSSAGIRKTPGKKISTQESELVKLAGQHEIIPYILKHRELEKLLTTYITPLYSKIAPDGRVHTTFVQTGAATGRLASQNPNLQNIPVQGEWAGRVKNLFIAEEGFYLVSFDYSQIELRVVAHIAKDRNMIDAFRKGEDIHTRTAAQVFEIPESAVTPEQRRMAKVFNFGILYGLSSHGLAQNLQISREEAQVFIDNYFERFRGVKRYIEKTRKDAVKYGYLTTIFGRKRFFEELKKSEHIPHNVKEAMFREAVNFPIQGCLPYNVRILTSRGYIPIGELYKSSMRERPKYVWDGTEWRQYEVLNRGKAKLAKIYLKNGQVLDCDVRHSILVAIPEGYVWKKFNELKQGDQVCSSMPRMVKFQKPSSIEFCYQPSVPNGIPFDIQNPGPTLWYWLGYYYGDGWMGKRVLPHKNNYERLSLNYVFGYHQGKLMEECKNYFIRLGMRPRVHIVKKITSPNGHERFNIGIESQGLGLFLKKIGLTFGVKANTKRFPERVYRETIENRRAFIKGFLDADGYYGRSSKDVVTLHLCQRDLLQDTFLLLKTLGVPSKIRGPYRNKKQVSYRLDIPRNFVFENILGSVSRKVLRMGSLAPRFLIDAFLTQYSGLSKEFFKTNSDYVEYRRWKNGGSCSIYFFDNFIKKYNLKLRLPVYDVSEIVSKKVSNQAATTYTLSVEESHRFDSEGIISKNTATGDIIKLAMIKVAKTLDLLNPSSRSAVRLLLQIHDDLLFEIKEEKLTNYIPRIKEAMEKVATLGVPLKVDVKKGTRWGQLNGV